MQNCLQDGDDLDLNLKLEKAPLRRKPVSEQLYSGHMRIDMGQPMTKGNLIVLKGDKRASGKSIVVEGTAKQFISESADNRVVYVSLSKAAAQNFDGKFSEDERKQIATIYAGESDAEQYLAPLMALKFI